MRSKIITRARTLILTFALVLNSVKYASAIPIYPSADGTVTKNFSLGTYSVDTTGPNIYSELLPADELRGILDFPINSIPVGSLVNSATLSLYVGFYGNGTGVDGVTGTFQMCGYVGNGTIAANDWNNDGVVLQNFDLTVGSFGAVTFDVTTFVQELVSSGDSYSGFLIQGFTPYLEVGFVSSEGAGLYPGPVLNVNFTPVPEPNVMTLLFIAGTMIAFRRYRWTTRLS